jgi:hypothetical protein
LGISPQDYEYLLVAANLAHFHQTWGFSIKKVTIVQPSTLTLPATFATNSCLLLSGGFITSHCLPLLLLLLVS